MIQWHLKPRRILQVLLGIACLIAILSLASEYLVEVVLVPETGTIRIALLDLFSVNLEESIPTWYSVIQLFVAASIFLWVALNKYRQQAPFRHYWMGLAILFVYLSMDEGAVIHEIAADPLQRAFNTTGFLAFGWQIIAVPILAILGVIYIRFFLNLPKRTRNLMLFSAIVYAGGALIIEGASAALYDADGVTMAYLTVATLEEFAEIVGVSLVIYTLLDYCDAQAYHLHINTGDAQMSPAHAESQAKHTPSRRVPLWIGAFVVTLVAVNLFTLVWQWGDEPIAVIEVELPFYHSIQSELDDTGTVALEIPEVFSINSGISREIAKDFLAQYDDVVIVALPADNQSVLFAGNAIPLNSERLSDLLHDNGIIEFVIYETATVNVFTSTPGSN